MANSYNSNPIILDTDIATGWRANQTLNTGSVPGYSFTRQPGIHPTKILFESAGAANTAGTVTVADPNDATVLWTTAVAASATTAAGVILTREDFEENFPGWRDFKVTGLTATGTKMYIWYRN